ncbi:MAG: OmpA family protein [Flavobacteriales bacterium TMED191]|nr:MAG: OmpA family protein [Flavobacteriales bacterium TMED191]
MLKIKNFLTVLILCASLSYGQSQFNDLNIGASFGLASEMGDVNSEGFNPVLGLNISKHISSQVSLSTKMMLGSLEGGKSMDAFDVNFMGVYANLAYHIIQFDELALYVEGGLGLLGFSGDQNSNDYSQGLFSGESFIVNRAIGFKYPFSNAINGLFNFSIINPLSGNGLDNVSENVNGFSSVKIGLSYGFGREDSKHSEWANPIDVMSSKLNEVEEKMSSLSIDTDGDGVADKFDKENDTPSGVSVDGSGKSLDVDSDGVADYKDIDPFTAPGVSVDVNGLELDNDKDGVPNSQDQEPNSPEGCTVNFKGVQIVGKGAFLPTVYFDVSSSKLDYGNYQRLATVASVLKANPSYKLRVIGFADSVGASDANYKLGLKRANAVIEILINTFSIDLNRLIADSQGENNLLANEQKKLNLRDGLRSNVDGTRFLNRRVEFIIE